MTGKEAFQLISALSGTWTKEKRIGNNQWAKQKLLQDIPCKAVRMKALTGPIIRDLYDLILTKSLIYWKSEWPHITSGYGPNLLHLLPLEFSYLCSSLWWTFDYIQFFKYITFPYVCTVAPHWNTSPRVSNTRLIIIDFGFSLETMELTFSGKLY